MAKQPAAKQSSKVNHPLHPAIVHFPIALYPISSLFVLFWFIWNNSMHLLTAYWLYLLAALFVLPVGITGVWDLMHHKLKNKSDLAGYRLVYTHIILGAVTTFLSLISGIYFLLHSPVNELDLRQGFIVFSFLLTLLVIAQGFLGGLMVYTHRLGVDDRRTASPRMDV